MSEFIGWDFFKGIFSWMTGVAQNEINHQRQSTENSLNRHYSSLENALNRDFNAKQAELAYDRQVEFYEKHQSLPARVKEYEQAGLNPVLAAGQNPVSPASTPSASSSAIGASTSALPNPFNLGAMLMEFQQKLADIDKTKAETKLLDKEVSWYDAMRGLDSEVMKSKVAEIQSNVRVNESRVKEISQGIVESMKRVDTMDSTISLNGALVDLHGSQKELNQAKYLVEHLTSKSLEKCLPYVEARQEAEIALTNARGEEAKASAEQRLYEANLSYLKVLVESDLIDGGYYDSLVENVHWSSKQAKRNYKWAPINDICSNASYLLMGVGSALGGTSSAFSNIPVSRNPIGFN